LKNWVILQLTEKGEQIFEEEPIIIENTLLKIFKGQYFLPLHYDKSKRYKNSIFLLKGYIFLEYSKEYISKYIELNNTPYFSGILSIGNTYSFVSDTEVQELKTRLNKILKPSIDKGGKVLILDGKYQNLEAIVMESYPDEGVVELEVNLQCMDILVPSVPIKYLKSLTN